MGKRLDENFKNPTNRYGVAPFWFLNGDLDVEELAWQVKEMKDKGLYGYVMHARYGIRIEYMSEEWFKRIDRIVKESEKHGMSAIIYDEDDWPSGMSGTKVIDDHPEYAHRQLTILWIECSGKNKVESDLTIDGLQVTDGKVIGAFASRFENKDDNLSKSKLKDTIRIENSIKDRKLVFDNKDGYEIVTVFINHIVRGYTVYTDYPRKKGWYAQPDTWNWYFPFEDYIDLMNPDAVDYFIETTHEEYRKRFGEHFGKAITQIFTDEPGFYTVMKEDRANSVPWTPKLPRLFKEEFGYDLVEYLPALLCDIGEKTSKVRYDFWYMVTKLFEENYIIKYHKWCQENNLVFTGHFRLCYPQLIWQRNYAGNVINLFRNMDAPGVDRLDTPGMCEKLGTNDSAWQIEDKILTSVAHQCGIERRMSESFALGGWDYRLADMKRVSDWQYMMGINFIVPHAFHYSITGQRKRECPPTEFYQNPMWENYKCYSDYICRLGEMMIGGKNVSDVAILYPMTTLWTEDVPEPLVDDLPNNIDRDFGFITDCLLRKNIDYDVIGEDEFGKIVVKDSSMSIGDANYSLLIVPPMITVRKETEAKILEFVNDGGKVLFLSVPPFKDIEGKRLNDLCKLFESEFDIKAEDSLDSYIKNDHKIYSVQARDLTGQLAYIFSGVLKDNNPTELIVKEIEKLISRDFKIIYRDKDKGNVYYNHHVKDNKDIYFIHNSDEVENYNGYDVEFYFKSKGKPYFYDPENGEIEEVYFYSYKENKTVIPYRIKPLEGIFVVFNKNEAGQKDGKQLIESSLNVIGCQSGNGNYKLDVYPGMDRNGREYVKILENGSIEEIRVSFEEDKEIKLSDVWNKKLVTPNALIINTWKLIQDEVPDMELPPESWDSVFGIKQKYIGEFIIKNFGQDLRAVFDRLPEILFDNEPQPVGVSINGVKVELSKRSEFLDHDMFEVDIRDLVKIGKNYVEIEFEDSMQAFEGKTGISPVSMAWDPVFIVGDFTLEPSAEAENRYVIVKEKETIEAKSWAKQGYPYLSGAMEYSQEINVGKDFIDGRKVFLDAGLNIREYMEVYVNGKLEGTRAWLPYKVDITGIMKPGKNEIKIIVRNTPKNILEKRKFDSGITGDIKIVSKQVKVINL